MMLSAAGGGHMDGQEEESTSGASTTDSAHRATALQPLRPDTSVHRQLRELEDENKKLAKMCFLACSGTTLNRLLTCN